jgi:prevent-host-death family protein
MRQVNVTELKNRLSRYLRLVKRGETLEITERSVPIAVVTGLPAPRGGREVLDRLVRDGVVSPARRPGGPDEIGEPAVPCAGDVVDALIEGRGDR